MVRGENRGMWKGIFAAVLFVFVFNGCTLTPSERHFVTLRGGEGVQRGDTLCDQDTFWEPGYGSGMYDEGLNGDFIKVLSWNIYKGNRDGWRRDVEKYSRRSDLLLLQEVAATREMVTFLDEQGMFWSFNSAFSFLGTEMGVLLASRVEPLKSCGLRSDEPLLGIPKTVVVSSFPIKGSPEKLLVVNVHGINFAMWGGAYKEQFLNLEMVIRQHEGPVLLTGDMNNWRQDREKVLDLLISNLSLTVLSYENDNRSLFFSSPVDHIFYRGLKPLESEVHQVTTSDHNPITVAFRLDSE